MATENLWCKSRGDSPAGFPGPDEWRSMPNGDRTCSFCGSLHPDDFARLVTAAADPSSDVRIEKATGKTYKWYVRQPDVSNAAQGGIKFYSWHSSGKEWEAQVNAVLPDALRASAVKFEIFMQDFSEQLHPHATTKADGGRDVD